MITEEMLLADIALISEIILDHGIKYAPFLDRLEHELALLRKRGDVLSRARRHLAVAKKRAAGAVDRTNEECRVSHPCITE